MTRECSIVRPRWSAWLYAALLIPTTATLFASRNLLYAAGYDAWASWLLAEDGPFESLGAVCCLLAGLTFLYAYFGRPQANQFGGFTTRRNLFYLLGGCLLLLMFLEEISWGQRLLGLRTPDWLARHHRVDELNLHNLALFQPDRSMNYLQVGWLAATLGYLGLLPLLVWVSPRLRRGVRHLALPVPSRVIAGAWWGAVLASLFVPAGNSVVAELARSQEAPEVMELTCEFLLLVFALETVLIVPDTLMLPARRGWIFLALSITSLLLVVGLQLRDVSPREIESVGRATQAQYLAAAGRPDEARRALLAAVELWPTNVSALARLGALDMNAGDPRRAAQRFEAALRIDPRQAECRYLLGITLLVRRDLDAAAEQLAAAVELAPNNPDYQEQLGLTLLHLGRLDAAVRHTAAAVRLAPQRADTHYSHALVLVQRGELPQAVAELDAALRIAPEMAEAREQLTRVRDLIKASGSQPASAKSKASP